MSDLQRNLLDDYLEVRNDCVEMILDMIENLTSYYPPQVKAIEQMINFFLTHHVFYNDTLADDLKGMLEKKCNYLLEDMEREAARKEEKDDH